MPRSLELDFLVVVVAAAAAVATFNVYFLKSESWHLFDKVLWDTEWQHQEASRSKAHFPLSL